MSKPYLHNGRTYTFTEDTAVIIAHRDDGCRPWYYHHRYGMTMFTTRTIGEMQYAIENKSDLNGDVIVWANNQSDALSLWNADYAHHIGITQPHLTPDT